MAYKNAGFLGPEVGEYKEPSHSDWWVSGHSHEQVLGLLDAASLGHEVWSINQSFN
jgi:hypothetical protein